MPVFMPGLELSRLFYLEAVRPILDAEFPGLPHSAGLIGRTSEVLGFDNEMSMDHDWGPKVMLFLREDDHARYDAAINETFRGRLPHRFRGYPTSFTSSGPRDQDAPVPPPAEEGPVNHWVHVVTLRGFLNDFLGFDIGGEIEVADWLSLPEQKLRMITAGAVHHDEVGLQAVRDRFAWYPHDVWLYLLRAGWWRIEPTENLVGRAGSVGDELGSALIGGRLVREIIRLCFLMEKQYAPYRKWFGTAFARLACGPELSPILWQVLRAETWPERETALVAAYETVEAMHNALHITEPVATREFRLAGRPFKLPWGSFPSALRRAITDPAVKRLVERGHIGSIEQFSDSTNLLLDTRWRPMLRRLYE